MNEAKEGEGIHLVSKLRKTNERSLLTWSRPFCHTCTIKQQPSRCFQDSFDVKWFCTIFIIYLLNNIHMHIHNSHTYADEKLIRIRLFRNLFVSNFYTHVEKVLTKRFWEKRRKTENHQTNNANQLKLYYNEVLEQVWYSNCDWSLQNQREPTQYFSMVYP